MSHIHDHKDSQALLKHILTLEVMSIIIGAIWSLFDLSFILLINSFQNIEHLYLSSKM